MEIVSDDDDDDDDDIMLTDEKYRPQSLEKMIALIAMLVEKSRGVDKQLHVSQKDYHSIVGGKASATPTLLSVSTCFRGFVNGTNYNNPNKFGCGWVGGWRVHLR